jgi:hypothetical protein
LLARFDLVKKEREKGLERKREIGEEEEEEEEEEERGTRRIEEAPGGVLCVLVRWCKMNG